uniref:Uncharacterized protein n=1 Tax=Sphaerodactylus townsendi TaxID=933632 RepID=A0ACB8GAW0_9SAUR
MVVLRLYQKRRVKQDIIDYLLPHQCRIDWTLTRVFVLGWQLPFECMMKSSRKNVEMMPFTISPFSAISSAY